MFNFKKFFVVLALSLLVLFAFTNLLPSERASARELEISYPVIGNVAAPQTTKTLLPDYIKYIFNFIIGISGIIIFGVIVAAGVQMLFSSQNPSAFGEAKNKIFDAIFGLLIVFGSYLILTTVNPQLVIINPIKDSRSGVVVYSNDILATMRSNYNNVEKVLAEADPNFAVDNNRLITLANNNNLLDFCNSEYGAYPENIPMEFGVKPGIDWERYGTSSSDLGQLENTGAVYFYKSGTDLQVNLYEKAKWDGRTVNSFIYQPANSCEKISSPAKSIELTWQDPGVYLCKDDEATNCSIYSASAPKLAQGFNDEIKYIKFKNPVVYDSNIKESECATTYAGRYFPKKDAQGNLLEQEGVCGYYPYLYNAVVHENNDYKGECWVYNNNNNDDPIRKLFGSSITVFSKANPATPPENETGATLFEHADYNNEGSEAGIAVTLGEGLYPSFSAGAISLENALSSIKVDDGFLAILFGNENQEARCEVFRNDEPNMGNTYIGNDQASSMQIIWTK